MRFLSPFWILSRRLSADYWKAKSQFYYKLVFASFGRQTKLIRPLKIVHPEHIFIGSGVAIESYCWLGAYPQFGAGSPRLTIGDGTVIGNFNHITCVNRVEIGRKVLLADRVHISDNEHQFQDIKLPVLEQPVCSRGPVEIGDGAWIGENVNVLSCKIGRNCVIGANAVVLSDVPDFSVAVGMPARVIKRYDSEKKQWVRV